MAEKRYYWLKLKEDFFKDKKIKKLRKIAGGDTYTIIYLKIQLLSLKNNGILIFEGVESTLEEELALELDEEVENVKITIAYLKTNDLLYETDNSNEFALPETMSSIGSESESAERVRRLRSKNKQALQCNGNVTLDIDKEKEKEIELEKDKDLDKENIKKENLFSIVVESDEPSDLVDIFNYWNTKDIIKHRDINSDIEKAIKKALKEHTVAEIKMAIDRYAYVYHDENYYFKHRWSLDQFLKQGNAYKDFLDNGSKWENYVNSKAGQKAVENMIMSEYYDPHFLDNIDMEKVERELSK